MGHSNVYWHWRMNFHFKRSKQVPHEMNDHYRMVEARYLDLDHFKAICSCLTYHIMLNALKILRFKIQPKRTILDFFFFFSL